MGPDGGTEHRAQARVGDTCDVVAGEPVATAAVETEDLGLHRPTLDEVFLALTGRPVDDDETPPGDAA